MTTENRKCYGMRYATEYGKVHGPCNHNICMKVRLPNNLILNNLKILLICNYILVILSMQVIRKELLINYFEHQTVIKLLK